MTKRERKYFINKRRAISTLRFMSRFKSSYITFGEAGKGVLKAKNNLITN